MSADEVKKWKANWQAHYPIFDEEEKKIGDDLAHVCPHLFAKWKPNPKEDAKKKKFIQVAGELNAGFAGGLDGYKKRLKKQMHDTSNEKFIYYKGCSVATNEHELTITDSKEDLEKLEELQDKGTTLLGNVAFVLVAGGNGKRLGLKGAKLAQAAEVSSHVSLLEHHITHLKAFQTAASKQAGAAAALPLVIMTGEDSHEEVKELLAVNQNFGLEEGQVTLIKQPQAPIVKDSDLVFQTQKDHLIWDLKQHGSGNIHYLLSKQAGLLAGWKARGIKQVVFFPDNNLLALNGVLEALGHADTNELALTYVAAPKKQDNISANTIITWHHKKPTERTFTTVIGSEFFQEISHDHKLKDHGSDGWSQHALSTGTFVADLDTYILTIESTEGVLPEYVKGNYKDKKKQLFKDPEGLNIFAEHYGEIVPDTTKVGIVKLPEWMVSAPFYHSYEEGKASEKAKHPAFTLASAESSLYYYNRRLLALIGADVEVDHKAGARVILSPQFALSLSVFKSKFSDIAVKISNKSVLTLNGADIYVNGLTLDGSLSVSAVNEAKVTLDELAVTNEGWPQVAISEKKRKKYKGAWKYLVRGFHVEMNQDLITEYNSPGAYDFFHQDQKGRPIGGWPDVVEELRPATGTARGSGRKEAGEGSGSRNGTPRKA